MSIFIDRKFLLMMAPKLERFAQKKPDLYNFRCPICGDSKKQKTKCRGFVYRKKNDYFYMCHNCGASITFYNFLKTIDPSLEKMYALERFSNGETSHHNYVKPTFEEVKTSIPKFKQKFDLPSLMELYNYDKNHYAVKYILDRKIPLEQLNHLYYAHDFKQFVETVEEELGLEKKKGLKDDDPRIVIPFHDNNNNITHFQGRSLIESNKVRYITISINEEAPKAFGLERIDPNKMVYVLEGPFDSMFIPNAIATADSNLIKAIEFGLKDITLVYDNEPRNKDIVKFMARAIVKGLRICIFPHTVEEKDINDQILAGRTPEQIMMLIKNNSYCGLRAQLEYMKWKKI